MKIYRHIRLFRQLLSACGVFLLLSGILTAQNSSQNSGLIVSVNYTDPTNESPNGYWSLTATDNSILGSNSENKWSGATEDVSIAMKWKDSWSIEHSIGCKYQWQEPPAQIKPGGDVKMVGTYTNNEYSTTNKVLTGLKIILYKSEAGNSSSGSEPIEILAIARDNRNYSNEVKAGFIQAPKTGSNETELRMIITCYAGSTKFTTVYTYKWTSTGD